MDFNEAKKIPDETLFVEVQEGSKLKLGPISYPKYKPLCWPIGYFARPKYRKT